MSKSGFFKNWTGFESAIRGFMVDRISAVYRDTRRVPQVEVLEWIEAKYGCSRCSAFYKLLEVVEGYSDLSKVRDPGFSNHTRNVVFIRYAGKLGPSVEELRRREKVREKADEDWWKPKRRLFGLLPRGDD